MRSIDASIKVELLASRPKNSKGKGKVWLCTFTTATASVGDDLSYLPLAHTILRETFWDVSLAINTGALLELRRSSRHQPMESSVLLDEDEDAKEPREQQLGLKK